MPVKLRLRRQGRKGIPYFHIVASDSRSPRDGKFIEKIGIYDPSRIPAHIEVNHEDAIKWLKNGAQPTETVRAILRYTGVTLKYALFKQGKTQEQADAIYNKWWEARMARVNSHVSTVASKKSEAAKAKLEAESKVRESKAAKIAAKRAAAIEAASAAETPAEAPAAEEAAPPATE